MENKNKIKLFGILVLIVVITTLCLSIFYSTAFIPSCILMTSLLLFIICYYVKDSKKWLMYLLFIMGVLLIFSSLIYTFMRVNK